MKLDKDSTALLKMAEETAKDHRHEFLTPEHLLKAFLSDYDILVMLDMCDTDYANLGKELDEYIMEKVPMLPEDDDSDPIYTDGFIIIFENAAAQCMNADKDHIEKYDLLVSMLDTPQYYCSYILRKIGMEHFSLIKSISSYKSALADQGLIPKTQIGTDNDFPQQFSDDMNDDEDWDEDADDDYDDDFDELIEDDLPDEEYSFNGKNAPQPDEPRKKEKVRKKRNILTLKKFTTDLTEKARNGELDALVGRTEEIERTIEILCRRKKNNPIHVGEPGVGKTAITEGLASMIVEGKVPDLLKGFSIFKMDIGTLVAGTRYRGDFEERIRRVMEALEDYGKAIVFIDEIHTLVGSGSGGDSSLDGGNMLKPVLSSGKVRCIGCTTYTEYARYFEKDSALSRRFQKIDILEPGRDESVKILEGLAPKYEEFHNVEYGKETLEKIVDFSVRYLPERRLPDKAIDIMDEAGSYTRIHEKKTSRVKISEDTIRKVTSRMARVPIEKIDEDEGTQLKNLEKNLSSLVLGQERAVQRVSVAVKKARAGFRNEERPEGAFLFVGPTGVGKTELAKSLASLLGEKLIRFDMSEYQEEHTISRLLGAPPGYVGYEEGGLLVNAVRNSPHSIILLDEIEKAHHDIFNVLLQVMDYGTLTDRQGRQADFRNCILILTSNAGAREMEKGAVGFSGARDSFGQEDEGTLTHAVEETFSPEFRNRLDAIIPFSHLGKDTVISIAGTAVKKISERLTSRGVKMTVSDSALRLISEKGYSREFGARNIYRCAEDEIASPLIDELIFGRLSSGGNVSVSEKDGKICFDFGDGK